MTQENLHFAVSIGDSTLNNTSQVDVGRYSWKTVYNPATGGTGVLDTATYQKVSRAEADAYTALVDAVRARGVRSYRNNMGRVSMTLIKDDSTRVEIWYHVTRGTAAVALSTKQAPWDQVHDNMDVAVGVLMSTDMAHIGTVVVDVDSAALPHVTRLLELRQDASPVEYTSIRT